LTQIRPFLELVYEESEPELEVIMHNVAQERHINQQRQEEHIIHIPSLQELGFDDKFIKKVERTISQIIQLEQEYQPLEHFPTNLLENPGYCALEDRGKLFEQWFAQDRMSLKELKSKMAEMNIDCTPLIRVYRKMDKILKEIEPRIQPSMFYGIEPILSAIGLLRRLGIYPKKWTFYSLKYY